MSASTNTVLITALHLVIDRVEKLEQNQKDLLGVVEALLTRIEKRERGA